MSIFDDSDTVILGDGSVVPRCEVWWRYRAKPEVLKRARRRLRHNEQLHADLGRILVASMRAHHRYVSLSVEDIVEDRLLRDESSFIADVLSLPDAESLKVVIVELLQDRKDARKRKRAWLALR